MAKKNARILLYSGWLTSLLLLLCPLQATATIQLQRSQSDDQLHYHYQWQHNDQLQQFSFSIPRQSMQQHLTGFRRYSAKLADTYMRQALMQQAAAQPSLQFQLITGTTPIEYQINAPDQAAAQQIRQQLQAVMQQARQRYLEQIYHTEWQLSPRRTVIMVDHRRIMQQSMPDLMPIAMSLQQKFPYTTTRELSQFLLDWIQRIPYQRLDDRSASGGEGFSPPLRVIQQHQGDCDSKAVLMAALLKLLLPDVRLAIVYLPNHAVLAIGMQPSDADVQLELEGQSYVLADPTGPALQPVGQVSSRYRIYLQPGVVNYRLL
ncbi:hypothetical protein Q3O60_07875 [Alkalimonas collagenimarina]|uniref:Transglutaminase-like domain-containing protein n=1 Tax=Alkalimonas collagenimarina TaxID=400390 RepID=A0ABT9GYH3_9GAMM|nr:hypothetical protein [Alkalimonas collagenimarina]MDP4536101.1 hypothetical protein [Alkalimonas collagenimarina]